MLNNLSQNRFSNRLLLNFNAESNASLTTSVRCARARFCLSSPMKREKCEQRHDSVFNLQPHWTWPFFSMKFVLPMSMHRLGRCAKFRILRKRHTKFPKKTNPLFLLFLILTIFNEERKMRATCFAECRCDMAMCFFSSKHSYRAAGCDRSSQMLEIRQQGSVTPTSDSLCLGIG